MSLIQELIDEGVMRVYHDYRSGGTNDLSGTGNDGVLVSGGQLNREGFQNDGAGSYVRLPFDSSVVFGNGTTDTPLTFISSMRMLKDGANTMIHKPFFGTGTEEYTFRFPSGRRLLMRLYDDANNAFIGQWANAALDIGENYICAGTYDGSGTSAGVKLYIDGLLTASAASEAGSYTAMNGTAENIAIGKFHVYYNISTIGYTLMIAKELTETEIAQITAELREMVWDKNISYQDEDDKKAFVGGMGAIEYRNIAGGFIGDTPFTVDTGSYHVGTETIDGEECRVIDFATGGGIYLTHQKVGPDANDTQYGTYECWVYQPAGTSFNIYLSNNLLGWPNFVGYRYGNWAGGGYFFLQKSDGATASDLMQSSESLIFDEWYKITLERTAGNVFTLSVNDTPITAVSGSNPVTDSTYTSATYIRVSADTNVKIAFASRDGTYAFKKENL